MDLKDLVYVFKTFDKKIDTLKEYVVTLVVMIPIIIIVLIINIIFESILQTYICAKKILSIMFERD